MLRFFFIFLFSLPLLTADIEEETSKKECSVKTWLQIGGLIGCSAVPYIVRLFLRPDKVDHHIFLNAYNTNHMVDALKEHNQGCLRCNKCFTFDLYVKNCPGNMGCSALDVFHFKKYIEKHINESSLLDRNDSYMFFEYFYSDNNQDKTYYTINFCNRTEQGLGAIDDAYSKNFSSLMANFEYITATAVFSVYFKAVLGPAIFEWWQIKPDNVCNKMLKNSWEKVKNCLCRSEQYEIIDEEK